MGDEPKNNVVKLQPRAAGVEIKRMDRNDKRSTCRHPSVWIWESEPIMECRDCGAMIDPFVWMRANFKKFDQQIADKIAERDRIAAETAELKAWAPWLRSLKALERIWRGKRMLPTCPHCRRGIEAEALANTGCVSRDHDAAMVARKAKE